MNPREERQLDLKGDQKLIYYCASGNPTFTHYAGMLTGKQVSPERKAKIISKFQTSPYPCPGPDPALLRMSQERDWQN
jgi:hypothetical protein